MSATQCGIGDALFLAPMRREELQLDAARDSICGFCARRPLQAS